MSRAKEYAEISKSVDFESPKLRDKMQVFVHRDGGLCFYPLARLDDFVIPDEEAVRLARWILEMFTEVKN